MVTPGLPPVPHVGGPILPPGQVNVFIGGLPAARVGDQATCVGPPDAIINGSPTVLIGNKPAARISDPTAHGGMIAQGCPTVLIGGPTVPANPPRRPSLFRNVLAGVQALGQKAFAIKLQKAAEAAEPTIELAVEINEVLMAETISEVKFEELTRMTKEESVKRFNEEHGEQLTVDQVDRIFREPLYASRFLSANPKVHSHYRAMLNQNVPNSLEEAKELGWEEQPLYKSLLHQDSSVTAILVPNVKYVCPDGYREVVFDTTGKKLSCEDYPDVCGTFNFHPNGNLVESAGHLLADMVPYFVKGSFPEDDVTPTLYGDSFCQA
jgi:uncharacterized Zn-binding protein involved in type VI secretion